MGIDRINSRPPSVPGPDPLVPSARPVSTSFSSALTSSVESSSKVAAPTTALQQLQSGQIDHGTYLDLKVQEATQHLVALPPEQLSSVRAALRQRMATDPTLVDLTRVATGRVPDASTDE